MNDLLALAIVRRLLLQLGEELPANRANNVQFGSLELWLRVRRSDLNGQSPLEVLREVDGEARLGASLRRMLEGHRTT